MEELLNDYYADNAQRLHHLVRCILKKFGGLYEKDYDDFYSLANEVFLKALHSYQPDKGDFEGYLYSCLYKRIKTEFTARNRYKRKAGQSAISLDAPVKDMDHTTWADLLADTFDLEKEVIGEERAGSSKIDRYLERLSKRQKSVVELLISCYAAGEIQNLLQITKKEYADAIRGIHAYDNVSVLF